MNEIQQVAKWIVHDFAADVTSKFQPRQHLFSQQEARPGPSVVPFKIDLTFFGNRDFVTTKQLIHVETSDLRTDPSLQQSFFLFSMQMVVITT